MFKLFKKIIKNLLPYGLVKYILKRLYFVKTDNHSVSNIHVQGAVLVSNRMEMLKALPKDAIVAEIGVDEGSFSSLILELCQPKKLDLIDIWGSERYGEGKAKLVMSKFKSELENGSMSIIRGLSTDAVNKIEDDYYDWVYIDTDHSYHTTLNELYAYSKKVKQNGFIAGHDYTMGNWEKGDKYGVIEAVSEFCIREDWKFYMLTIDYTENQSFVITRI